MEIPETVSVATTMSEDIQMMGKQLNKDEARITATDTFEESSEDVNELGNTEENDDDEDEDDEPDEWDQRINKTGCGQENFDLQICYADKRDWRLCLKEMKAFKECWKNHGNIERTSAKDSPES